MTHTEIVLDASALLRGILGASPEATQVFDAVVAGEIRASAPDLIDAEATHALVRLTRAGVVAPTESRRLTALLGSLPVERHAAAELAAAALEHALAHRLSAYDALYGVLADAIPAPLVTADRRLAATVADALLLA